MPKRRRNHKISGAVGIFKNISHNGWGLTKFCLLPNLKNMKKPKGKILFKPLLAAVASTKLATKDRTFFVLNIFLAGLLFFS